ncbi:hypothetical protein EG329_013638 [Mollisiaceae sp. DMI_Dod_QoI]|nr:hypothetical protein EG329_013638 [Helotiales sp. DMI_Dod_QoI]
MRPQNAVRRQRSDAICITSSASTIIDSIRSCIPHAPETMASERGTISYIELNSSDHPTILWFAEETLKSDETLDVIIHNEGVIIPANPQEKTELGYYLQLGINVLAKFSPQTLRVSFLLVCYT